MKIMKNMIKKITLFLVSKQPEIQNDIIEDYLDKKVVSLRIDEFNQPEQAGERIKLENVVLHKTIINNSVIETEGLLSLGNHVVLSNNIINKK
jgi:hypothetical protein